MAGRPGTSAPVPPAEGAPGTAASSLIRIVGLSHHTAPLEVRERVAFGTADYGPTLRRIMEDGQIREGVLLSTCNRSELVAVVDAANGPGMSRFKEILSQRAGSGVEAYLRSYQGPAAVEHLFRVAASLDSQVVGEAQILGQVNEAYEAAAGAGLSGPILDRLFARARSAARRVRAETAIGESHVSVASVAVELAEKIFSSLHGRSVLIIGAGETGLLTLQHLLKAGIQRAYVASRSESRGRDTAASLGAVAVAFERRLELLTEVDVVISATASDQAVLNRPQLGEAMSRRHRRPIFLIDLAVPRDIDPDCGSLDGAFLFNIDDLSQVVSRNLAGRMKEARQGEIIVAQEAARFVAWLETRQAVPTVVALRRLIESIRSREEEKALARLGHLSPRDREAVRAYGAGLVNKILHAPTVRLRNASDAREAARLIEAVRELFYLDEDEEG